MDLYHHNYDAVHSQVRQPIRHSHHICFIDTRLTNKTTSPSFIPKLFPIKACRSISVTTSRRYPIILVIRFKVYTLTNNVQNIFSIFNKSHPLCFELLSQSFLSLFLSHYNLVQHIFSPLVINKYCTVVRPLGQIIFSSISRQVSLSMRCP